MCDFPTWQSTGKVGNYFNTWSKEFPLYNNAHSDYDTFIFKTHLTAELKILLIMNWVTASYFLISLAQKEIK